jgi:integrase
MPRRGENIYKRKDGRWEGRYIKSNVDGSTRYGYVYAKSYKEVKEKLIIKTTSHQSTDLCKNIQHLSFKSVSEEWLKNSQHQLKESSVIKYMNILKNHLYPKYGDMNIEDFNIKDISDFSVRLLNSGGANKTGLSPKTVSSILSVLKSIFEYAEKSKGFSMPDISSISVKQNAKPMRVLSVTEQNKLNQYLYENLSLTNVGILICMYTGIRIGEICALKWKNVSFSEHCIFIESTMQRLQQQTSGYYKTKIVISEPKSCCSIRRVPIPDNLYETLKNLQQNPDCFLLTGDVKEILEPRTLQNRFKAVIKKCGIQNANFHSLRHTFATRCVEVGVDVKSLSEILGHASVNITLNKYVHPSMEQKLKNINMLSDLLTVK